MQKNIVIYIEDMKDVSISDTQELMNSMATTNLTGKVKRRPLADGKIYPVKDHVTIIEIDYLDMYIKVMNEHGSTFIGQIIEGLDIEFDEIPSQLYIESYQKEDEHYYIYAKY